MIGGGVQGGQSFIRQHDPSTHAVPAKTTPNIVYSGFNVVKALRSPRIWIHGHLRSGPMGKITSPHSDGAEGPPLMVDTIQTIGGIEKRLGIACRRGKPLLPLNPRQVVPSQGHLYGTAL